MISSTFTSEVTCHAPEGLEEGGRQLLLAAMLTVNFYAHQ